MFLCRQHLRGSEMCAASGVPFIEADEKSAFEPVASLGELAEGTVLQRVRSSGDAICLVRHNGEISALSDICTHQHFSMSQGDLLVDGTLQCAWHGARYDCRTGEVRQEPATSPLPVFMVRLEGDTILVGPRAERIDGKYRPSTVSAK
jgi:3-phenylpropionate/trans-cinnamate dioxygenase ferredoxin subunit